MIYKPSGPLVAPSLRSGRYSPGARGFLNRVDPLVSVSIIYYPDFTARTPQLIVAVSCRSKRHEEGAVSSVVSVSLQLL